MANLSRTPDVFDQYLGLMAKHEELITAMKGLIVPKNPVDPGGFLDEYAVGSSTPISLQLNVDRPCLVTNILISFNPVNAASLVIGQASGQQRVIPIPQGSSTFFPIPIVCNMIIRPTDVFTLNATSATSLYIEVMGKILSGTDWSFV